MTAKRFFYIVLTALFVACCTDDAKLDDIQKQIDEIKGSEIAAISAQMEAIQASLTTLRQVDAEAKAYNSGKNLPALAAADEALVATIANLQSYSSQEVDNLDWFATTIVTLEKHSAVLVNLAAIKVSLGEPAGSDASKLLAAIASAEASVKTWVDKDIEGYYTIALADAKFKALEDAMAGAGGSFSGDMDKLREDLDSARINLTAAYQAAIAEAISTNNGVIDQKIAADIQTATSALQTQIDAITTRLNSLEARIAALESSLASLINSVKSIAVIPTYSDGSVFISDADDNTIHFEVQPHEAGVALAAKGASAFSLDYVETLTRSSMFTNIPVTNVSYDNEILSIEVDGSGLPQEVKLGEKFINARLRISDGTVTRSSSFFHLAYRLSPVSVELLPIGQITDVYVTLSAKATMSRNSTDEVFGGFAYSEQESELLIGESSGLDTLRTYTLSPEGVFSCRTKALKPSTTYYYRPFVSKNGHLTYGEASSFSVTVCATPQPSVTVNTQLVDFSWTTNTDEKYVLEVYVSPMSASSEPDPDDLYVLEELTASQIPYTRIFPYRSGRYYYRVKAQDILGQKGDSGWAYGNFKIESAYVWPNSADAFDYGASVNVAKTASMDPNLFEAEDIEIGDKFTDTVTIDKVTWLSSSSNQATYKGDHIIYNRKKGWELLPNSARVSNDVGFRLKINKPGTLRFSFKLTRSTDVWEGKEQKIVIVLWKTLSSSIVTNTLYDARPSNISTTTSEISVTVTTEMLMGITEPATICLWHEMDNDSSAGLQFDYYPPVWTPAL